MSRLKQRTFALLEWLRLKPRPKKSFANFLLDGPKFDDWVIDIINDRSRDLGRTVDLDDLSDLDSPSSCPVKAGHPASGSSTPGSPGQAGR